MGHRVALLLQPRYGDALDVDTANVLAWVIVILRDVVRCVNMC